MSPKGKKVLVTMATAGLAGVLVMAGCQLERIRETQRSSATFEFKWNSLQQISGLTADPAWVTNRLAAMAREEHEDFRWLSPQVIRLESGEWLVYANKCQKEDPRITDTFVARASDGNWYHSTNHFCKGMVVLLMEGQPRDLKTMMAQYHLSRIEPPAAPPHAPVPASH